MLLFEKLIAKAKNVNYLPSMASLFVEINKIEDRKIQNDENNSMIDNWDGTEIILLDGSKIQLGYLKFGSCLLHSRGEVEGEYIYKIEDNLYICAECLAYCVAYPKLEEKYIGFTVGFLFPKSWSELGVISWLKKYEKRQAGHIVNKNSKLSDDEDDNF